MSAITSTIAAVGATTRGASPATAGAGAQQRLAGDMRSFLQLLTTQLRNQDPTQPLDANQFTAQLAQFASVEQQIASNQHMESLLSLQRASTMVAAAPLLGRQVEVASDRIALQGGHTQELRLPTIGAANGATRARIALTGANGQVLREQVVPLGANPAAWTWDGRDARGRALPDGNYALSVVGLDAEGVTRGTLPSTLAGTVTAVAREGEMPRLSLGALGVGIDALRRLQ